MAEQEQEQEQTGGKRTLGEWTRQAAEVSTWVAASPTEAGMERLSEFAAAVAAEGAKREARGRGERLAADGDEAEAAKWSAQMAALAKQAMALARARAGLDGGSALGSFVAFYGQAAPTERAEVLNFDAHLAAGDPRWRATIDSLAKRDGVELDITAAPARAPGAPGEASESELAFLRQAGVGQSWSALGDPAGPAPKGEAMLEAWIDKVGDLKGMVAKSEVARGRPWGEQGASGFFVQNVDSTLAAMGAGFIDAVRRSGLDPSGNPAIGASLVALSSMMSQGAGARLLSSVFSGPNTPEQAASWDAAILPAWRRSTQKWKAGQAVQAGSSAERAGPTVSAPAAAAPAYAAGRQMGAGARKALSGFVEAFSFSKGESGAGHWVDRANEATDRLESRVRASLGRGVRAGARTVDAAKEALHSKAQRMDEAMDSAVLGMASAREQFAGKVGEARRAGAAALGSLALKARDALPSAEAIEGRDGNELQKTMLQMAAVTGALFVGVSMAPVAGFVGATVGAIAAGLGLGRAMGQMVDAARLKASGAPAALESIGQRLGAKRAERAIEKVEPMMGAAVPGF